MKFASRMVCGFCSKEQVRGFRTFFWGDSEILSINLFLLAHSSSSSCPISRKSVESATLLANFHQCISLFGWLIEVANIFWLVSNSERRLVRSYLSKRVDKWFLAVDICIQFGFLLFCRTSLQTLYLTSKGASKIFGMFFDIWLFRTSQKLTEKCLRSSHTQGGGRERGKRGSVRLYFSPELPPTSN